MSQQSPAHAIPADGAHPTISPNSVADHDPYRALFYASSACWAILRIELDGPGGPARFRVDAINDALARQLGTTEAKVVGGGLDEVFPPEALPRLARGLAEVYRAGGPGRLQVSTLSPQEPLTVDVMPIGADLLAITWADVPALPSAPSPSEAAAERALDESQLESLRRERYLEALVEVQQALLSLGSSEERRQRVLEVLGPASGASRVYVFENRWSDQGELLASLSAEWCAPGVEPQLGSPAPRDLPYGAQLSRWLDLLSNGETISGRVAELPAPERAILEAQGVRSILALPLTVGGDYFGFIGFDDCVCDRRWEPVEVSLLKAAAAAIAVSEERSQAENRLRYVSFHDSLTGVYNRACFEVQVSLLDGGRDYPVSVISADIDGLKLINDTMGHRVGDDLLKAFGGLLKATFRPSDVIARVGGDEFAIILPRTGHETAEALCRRLERNVASFASERQQIPMSISFGVETAENADVPLDDVFKRADRAMYQDKLRRSASASHGIVTALLEILKAKDEISEGHTRRVADLAVALGRTAGLSKREMSHLELLAEVHDLGKVGIPDSVLFKPGPLSEDEREQMNEHSAIGYRIAKSSPELTHIAELILHHHEWWNGQGYPLGLRGEAIPLVCRILSIVDAYDAMTNDRPYRRALRPEAAVAELKRCAGIQFDPELVERFAEHIISVAQSQVSHPIT